MRLARKVWSPKEGRVLVGKGAEVAGGGLGKVRERQKFGMTG